MGSRHASRSIVSLLLVVLAPSMGCDGLGSSAPSRFPPASTVANRCDDPAATWQWVRSTVDELYLWADDVVDADPSASATPEDYFRALLVRTPTASGHPRDSFSEAYPTGLFQAALPVWHGVRWALHGTDARALYVRDQTPAALAGVRRGDRVVAVAGTPVETLGAAAVSAALSPPPGSGPVELTLADPAGATRTVDLGLVTFSDPGVLLSTVLDRPQGRVGYVAFTSQLGDPVGDMTAAVRRFVAARGASTCAARRPLQSGRHRARRRRGRHAHRGRAGRFGRVRVLHPNSRTQKERVRGGAARGRGRPLPGHDGLTHARAAPCCSCSPPRRPAPPPRA